MLYSVVWYLPTVQFYIDTCLVPHMQKQGRLPPAPAHTKLCTFSRISLHSTTMS